MFQSNPSRNWGLVGGGELPYMKVRDVPFFGVPFLRAENKFWGTIFGKITSTHKFWGVILEK